MLILKILYNLHEDVNEYMYFEESGVQRRHNTLKRSAAMKSYSHVFQPMKIRNKVSRNRIEVSPAEPFLATKDGFVTNAFLKFTAAMARGGAGIVTVGDSPVNQAYADENHYVINLAEPFIVHSLTQITDAIHRYGALANIELNLRAHWAPADLSKEEIKQVIEDFASSAEKCKKGGFDMVIIHGGHGHNVAQFYSPFFNKRTDEYGCDTFENRCRFANELIDAVRERIGDDMAIEYRISGDELTEKGVGIEESLKFAKSIQHKIDLIHVSAGNLYDLRTIAYQIQPTYIPHATNLRFAERYKQELDIPVVTVGSYTMDLAEDVLAEDKVDMVAMIRSFIADHDMVNKARKGKGDEIRPCIRCCICTGADPHGCPVPLRCSVNAVAGRNDEFDKIEKALDPKRVLVVGGGCGGMEAARRLAQRGHLPILVEKDAVLGGTLTVAGANPIKEDVKSYGEWSVRMTHETPGIDIRLNTVANKDLLESENPDALIIAVGSDPISPDIPGIESEKVVQAVDVDQGKVQVGKKVVVAGAGLTGTETAVYLAQTGHDVTLIDLMAIEEIDRKSTASMLITGTLRGMAAQLGVKVMEKVCLYEVTQSGAVVKKEDGDALEIPCDNVVLSLGVRPRSSIVDELTGVVDETYVIGDCANKAGNITTAVQEAFFAAMNIE